MSEASNQSAGSVVHAQVSAQAPQPLGARLRRYAFAIVPAIGLFELVAHVAQVSAKIPDGDWVAARDVVKTIARPSDLITFAPAWASPVARSFFGDDLATLERMGRPDVTRFPRAIEVSIRGKHDPELTSWKKVGEERFGRVTVSTLENPEPVKLLDDLVSHVRPGGVIVERVDRYATEETCAFLQTASQSGNIGFGPAVPGDRFACNRGGFAGISVVPDLTYAARRCIFVPPQGGATVMRLRFQGVHFGTKLRGHHLVSVHAERALTGTPVLLTFKVGERTLGKLTHTDGDGWKGFELPTADLAGTTGELVAEVQSASGDNRQYCFEADTR